MKYVLVGIVCAFLGFGAGAFVYSEKTTMPSALSNISASPEEEISLSNSLDPEMLSSYAEILSQCKEYEAAANAKVGQENEDGAMNILGELVLLNMNCNTISQTCGIDEMPYNRGACNDALATFENRKGDWEKLAE